MPNSNSNNQNFTIESTKDTSTFPVKAVPGASRDQIVGLLGDALKIKVASPPEAGKANKAIIALLAKTLNIPKSNIAIESGHTRPQKRIAVQGLTPQQIRDALAPYLDFS